MSMSDTVLAQFDQVAMGTRQHLESIPDEKLGWEPHEKSYSIGELVLMDPDVTAFGSEFTDDTAADLAAFQSCDRTSAPAGQGAENDIDS